MKNQSFIQTDAGRIETGFQTENNDCIVRAFAVARDIPYHVAHSIFEAAGRRRGHGLRWDQIAPVLLEQGFEVSGRMWSLSLSQFLRNNRTGSFFLIKRGHAFAVKNGVVFDMFPIGGNTKVVFFAKALEK